MKLVFSPDAINDILETKKYISKVLKNPAAAKRIAKMLNRSCKLLKDRPLMGMSVEEKTGHQSDFRYLICENWLAFYKVEDDQITVVRVLDGRTDYVRVLFFPQ